MAERHATRLRRAGVGAVRSGVSLQTESAGEGVADVVAIDGRGPRGCAPDAGPRRAKNPPSRRLARRLRPEVALRRATGEAEQLGRKDQEGAAFCEYYHLSQVNLY